MAMLNTDASDASRESLRLTSRTEPLPDEILSREVFRQIYATLDLPADGCPVIGVTSSIRGEGRTTVALGLAHTLSHDLDQTVVLAELDGKGQSLADRFGLEGAPGFLDMLQDGRGIDEITHRVSPHLSIIPSGQTKVDASGILRRLADQDPWRSFGHLPGAIVVDLPPVMDYSYTVLAASITDALVLVVRAGVTPAKVIREAIGRLEDRPPQGIVLNGPHTSFPTWWPGGTSMS